MQNIPAKNGPELNAMNPNQKQPLRSRLRPLRLRIAPEGSRRERVLRLVVQGLRTWKQEGFLAASRKAVQKSSSWLARQARNVRQAESRLDLRAVPQGQLIPGSYDVIVLTGFHGQIRAQPTWQLVRHFARDGHRVFYISPKIKKASRTKVRLVEEGVFEVQLAGHESGNLSSDEVQGQVKESVLSTFNFFRNELTIVDAICFLDLPPLQSIAFSLRDTFGWRIIYGCGDEQRRFEDHSTNILEADEELIEKSDLVLVHSESLFREVEKHNPNCLRKPSYAQIKERVPTLFPTASIVIVTYNNVEYTRLCLNSLYEKTIYPNFEVILVDNASTDGTLEFLRSFEAEHEHIQILCNGKNEGFAQANNLGMASAQGDYIVLLNNDTIVTRVWLSRLTHHLRNHEVGLVGSVSNGVSNEAYVEMPFTELAALDAFSTQLANERSNCFTPIKMLAMYCMAGRREVFQQIGPLDEQFGLGMFEDDDYSLRVRQAGYRIGVAEDVFVHHFGRSGFKLLGDERYLALFEENRKKFQSKWNITWEQHVSGTLAENRLLAADLESILKQYPEAPGVVVFPPTIGWNISLFQRPHQLARAFANKGFLVFFCTEAHVDNLRGFRQVTPGLYLANVPWGVFDPVERPITFTLPYNREYLFQLRQPIAVYEVIDDLDVFPGDPVQLQKNHELSLKEADLVLVTADRLMERVKPIRPDAILCPNAVELEHFSGARETQPASMPPDLAAAIKADHPVIGYYGAFARWFDYDLLRQAAQAHSEWDFLFIGPNHDNTLIESNILSMPNIHWLGPRDYSQLPDYLRHFTVATIPFLINNITLATSPIKLFEYMAAGKPIVTSDLPECRKYAGVFVARNSEEFIRYLEHALTLTHDSAYIEQLYETAEENTWAARINQMIHALDIRQKARSPQEP